MTLLHGGLFPFLEVSHEERRKDATLAHAGVDVPPTAETGSPTSIRIRRPIA